MIAPSVVTKLKFVPKDQRYYFVKSDDGKSLSRAVGTLIEDEQFHELLARHKMKAILMPNMALEFKGIKSLSPKQTSVFTKELWDTFRPMFEDFGVSLGDQQNDADQG